MQFNVPFITDGPYTRCLSQLDRRLHAIHFSLNDPAVTDARIRLRSLELGPLMEGLQSVPIPKKYLLANGRFQPAGHYQANNSLDRLIGLLDRLQAAGVLHGIIFSDPYFLKALSDAAPDLAARIEAVPSINFMIDSAARLAAVLAIVTESRFRPPGKITLDRALNRRPKDLRELATTARERYPHIKIELLANEGCLNHCPFRATHEALIAAANTGATTDTFRLNRDLGCMRILTEAPHHILASPFIRPEDLGRYTDVVDIIKICGRTLGPAFLQRTVAAYGAARYEGNLLDLLDAAHWMAERWDLPNGALPADFIDRLTTCDQACCNCAVCRDLFQRHARPLPVHLKAFGAGTRRPDLKSGRDRP